MLCASFVHLWWPMGGRTDVHCVDIKTFELWYKYFLSPFFQSEERLLLYIRKVFLGLFLSRLLLGDRKFIRTILGTSTISLQCCDFHVIVITLKENSVVGEICNYYVHHLFRCCDI